MGICVACLVMGLSPRCPSPVLHGQYRAVPTLQQALALVFLQNPANPRISAALLWVQLGKELQHPHWADYEAGYQHVLWNVHGKLHELDTVGMREQMEQQLQQWFPECW